MAKTENGVVTGTTGGTTIPVAAGQNILLGVANADLVVFSQDGSNLVVTTIADGASIVLEGFFSQATTDLPPQLTLSDGSVISAQEVTGLVEEFNPDLVAPAAGGPAAGAAPNGGGAGFNAFEDDGIGDGIGISGLLDPTALGFADDVIEEEIGIILEAGIPETEGRAPELTINEIGLGALRLPGLFLNRRVEETDDGTSRTAFASDDDVDIGLLTTLLDLDNEAVNDFIGVSGRENVSFIELQNRTEGEQSTSGEGGGVTSVSIIGPEGAAVTVELPAVTIPAAGRLVLMQTEGEGGVQTVYVVFNFNGAAIDGGSVADNVSWPMGADTSQPLGVLVSHAVGGAVTEVDTFLANGAQFAPAALNDGWDANPDPAATLDIFGDSGTFNGKIATQELVAPGIFDVYSPISLTELLEASPIKEIFFLDIAPNNVFGRVDNADTDNAADWTTGQVPTVGRNNATNDRNPQDPTYDNMNPGQPFGNLLGPNDETDSNGQNVIIAGVNDDAFVNEFTGAIEGGRGQDFIIGDEGNNTLLGGGGNDLFSEGSGNDIMDSHNDYLDGGAGNDVLKGQSGGDVLIDDQGRDMLIGGTGTDILFGRRDPLDDVVTDTGDNTDFVSGDDVDTRSDILSLIGKGGTLDSEGDLLVGDETLNGSLGGGVLTFSTAAVSSTDTGFSDQYMRDIIVAGDGSDVIFGDNANLAPGFDTNNIDNLYLDLFIGFINSSTFSGGESAYDFANWYRGFVQWNFGGADLIYGGGGNDMIFGQGGDDGILAGAGADLVAGGTGNDNIHGNDGDDALFGDTGDDTIYGDAGRDYIEGNEGADSLLGGSGNDTMRGGDGADTLYGGDDGDDMFGDDGADMMWGEAGDDFLRGGAGNDGIFGGVGSDLLYGGEGDDNMQGHTGSDLLRGDGGNDWMLGGAGNDWMIGNEGADTMRGGDDADTMHGDVGADSMFGDAGNDLMTGGDDADYMSGGLGADDMSGDAGADTMDGGLGADTMDGGEGNDVMQGNQDNDDIAGDAGDDLIWGDSGDDTLFGDGGADTLRGGIGNDEMSGGSENDWMEGADGADSMDGDAGDDNMFGGAGNDIMDGGSDDDDMYGGADDDLMTGGLGNDTLTGDDGSDNVEGEEGNDVLRWTAVNNSDGSADIYDGGDNTDTLELYFTVAEFAAHEGAIAEFANRLENGEDNVTLTIGAKTLTASDIEYVHVHVDGLEVPVLIDDTFTTDEDTDLTEQLTAMLANPEQDFVPNDLSKPTTFSQPGDVTITPAGGGAPIVIAAASWGDPVGGVWSVDLTDGPMEYGVLRVDASNPDAATVTLEVGSAFGSMNDGDVATVVFNYNAEVQGTETAQVTINVNGVDEESPVVAAPDIVITNESGEIYIPEYALLSNDVDPEGDPLSVTNVENPPAAQDVADYVNVTPSGDPGTDLDFDYDATDGGNSDTANVVVESQLGSALIGNERDEIVIGSQGADTIAGGAGDDTIAGGAGNDLMYSQEGEDVFHYYGADTAGVGGAGNTDGDDIIFDFDANDDVINLDALFDALGAGNAETRADLVNLVSDGTDTTLTVDGASGFSITLDNVDLGTSDGTLNAADLLTTKGIDVGDES